MKWITRNRPKIDRLACPWLINNFVDVEVEFKNDHEMLSIRVKIYGALCSWAAYVQDQKHTWSPK